MTQRFPHPVPVLRRVLAGALLAVGLLGAGLGPVNAQSDAPVYLIPVEGEIDLGVAPFLSRTLTAAADADAAAAVLLVDTPGGRLDAVLQMRDALLDAEVPTIAFIDATAFSAGALVALAAHEIHFAPGGVMGAATPVVGGAGDTADPKVIAAVRSTFRATAEARDRDPRVAEAMVDASVTIDGLSEAGSLLSLSAAQASEVGYLDGTATDVADLLRALGLDTAPLVETEPTFVERVVRVITSSAVAPLLVTVGTLLIVGELFAGAFGIAGTVGVGLLVTFFYGHLLAGLAGWEDVLLVGVGIVLLLIEVLVVPGFGVAGILGIAAVLAGTALAMLGRDFDFVASEQLVSTATAVGLSFVVTTLGLVVLLTLSGRRARRSGAGARTTGRRRGLAGWLGDGDVLERESDADSASRQGAVGRALSDLHPAGVADFDGHRVDVVTEGGYVAAGERVEVLRAERYRRVVRRIPD